LGFNKRGAVMTAKYRFTARLCLLCGVLFSGAVAFADGTEVLGFPSIELEYASGISIGGTGLFAEENGGFVNLDGEIFVSVPQGAVVKQVLLYWNSEHYPQSGPDTSLLVNGTSVTGTVIGGPTNFFSQVFFAAVRADITDLGVVGPGSNTVEVSALDSSFRNTGAGIVVLYDDESSDDAYLADGLDLAYFRRSAPLDATVPVGFEFEPADEDRVARLPLLVGSVGNGRPNVTRVFIGDREPLVFYNLFSSMDGDEWDSLTLEVDVPAGESYLEIQLFSEGDGSGGNPASIAWIAAGIDFAPVEEEEECAPCEGGVTELQLQYNGQAQQADVFALQKKGRGFGVPFRGTVNPGDIITLTGLANDGTLGDDVYLVVDWQLDGVADTSCDTAIGPGTIAGSFEVVGGRSANGATLCPIEQTPDCDRGEPVSLTFEYTGASCDAQQHSQNLSTTQCIDDENDPDYVYVIATDHPDPWGTSDWNMLLLERVDKGETFTIDAGKSGLSKLKDITALFIFDPRCVLIKAVTINSSCREPLNVGDVFGPVTLVDYSTESEGGVMEPITISH